MTERLDLHDARVLTFDAEVIGEGTLAGHPAVELSRTAFYPEGGGQPADRGTLAPAGGAPAAVLDVQEVEGRVLHAVDRPLPRGPVTGAVDAARRRDHLQQHHGQHLLSAAFERALGAATVSFHLGEATCTIDLELPHDRLTPAVLARAEAGANALVWADLEVSARERTAEELGALPLRKAAVKGARVVVVRGEDGAVVDASPCGGTHPRRTGEVGAVAVLGAQRWGAGSRVEFVCGGRVTALLRARGEALAAAGAALHCAPAEVPAAAGRLAAEASARRKELEKAAGLLAAGEAERLAAAAGGPVVGVIAPAVGGAAGWLRAVAQALAARGRAALLGANADGRALLCFARPPGPGVDLGALLREAAAALGGKGGGAPALAQGGGPDAARLDDALAAARAKLGA